MGGIYEAEVNYSFDEGAAFGRYLNELLDDGESLDYISELIGRERQHFISCFSKEPDIGVMTQEWEKGLSGEFKGRL